MPPHKPPISAARRDVSRVARLHWLTGGRSADHNWDAFEAPDGGPLLTRRGPGAAWSTVKVWLLDLALTLGALAVGATWAIARPTRGLHDRLVRTWIVPR